MNYLAHAFLSNNDTDLLIGNFIADHLRGNNLSVYPDRVVEGIKLHRQIDSFTDSHPEFKKAKRLFYNGFEKHSGILVDIYFDHLLAKNFMDYSNVSLNDFSQRVYEIYHSHTNLLPEGSQRFLQYVIKNNIYSNYSTIVGIERVLYHLSHRIKHGVQLNDSVNLFDSNETEMNMCFTVFFKEALSEFGTAKKE